MPTIRISLTPNGEIKTFRKKETLIIFLEEEQEYWQNFFIDKSPTTNVKHSTQYIINTFNQQLSNTINSANEIADDYSNINVIQDSLSAMYTERRLIYSKAPFSNLITSETDSLLAIFLVGSYVENGYTNVLYDRNANIHHYLKPHINEISNYMNTATVLKTMFERGYENNLDSEKESLVALKNNWDTVLQNEVERAELQEGRFTKIESSTEQCQSETSNLFSKQKRRFAQFMNTSKNEIKGFKDFYEKKLALKSAVTYWRNKKYISYVVALILGVALSFIGYFTIDYLFTLSNTIGNNLKDISAITENSNTTTLSTNIKYLPILHFLVISTFAIWGLRILVKIFLSKLHSADNASEREMFIKSYLALLNEHEGSIEDEKDRQLILQAIFRPSSDGLISDEGPKLTDIINSIKGK